MTKALTTTQHNQISIVDRLLANKRSEHTRAAYKADLATFESFLGAGFTMANVRPEDWKTFDPALLTAYYEWLSRQISDKTGRSWSTATIARKLTAVRELLTEAGYLGLVDRSQLDYIKERIIPAVEVSNVHHPTIAPEDQVKLLTVAAQQPGLKGLRDYALFRLWLDTGLRRAELAALQVGDLATKGGVSTVTVKRGKGRKARSIGIEGPTAGAVFEWLEAAAQTDHGAPVFVQLRKVGRGDNAEYVIPEYDHAKTKQPARLKPLSGPALYALVKWYRTAAGIESELTPHSFRVALVTDLVDRAPLAHVQAVTGHTDTRMILNTYNRNQYGAPVARYRPDPLPTREALVND